MKKPHLGYFAVFLFLFSSCQNPLDQIFTSNESSEIGQESIEEPGLLENTGSTTVIPTFSPEVRVTEADYALFSGQLDKAKQRYQEAFELAPGKDEKAAALYGLGRSYYTEKNYGAAIDAFNRIFGQYPESEVTAEAYFMVAECYFDIEEYQLAADSYARFVQLNPGVIDNYALTLAGDASLKAGNFSQAIFHYQAAVQAIPPGNTSYLNLQIGKAYEGLEDFTTAIQYYTTTYETAEDDFSKSTANLLAGQAYLKLGLDQEAYTRLMDSVIQFPKSFDSYTALTILVTNRILVNDFYRGLVDYYAGSVDPTLYDLAIQAFDRFLASNPDNNDGSVHYFKGLSHYFVNEPRDAIGEYEILIQNYPANPYWASAWDEKAFVQWAVLEEYTNAADTYLAFVSTAPTAAETAGYLYEAGRVYERSGSLELAASTWQRLMNEYPSEDISYRGLFMAGISYYRLGQFEEALSIFQRSLVLGTNPVEKAKSYLWIGKCHQSMGNLDDADNAWELGKLADPTDYYSIRSSQLQNGMAPFLIEDGYDLGYDLDLERSEAENWLRSTFSLDPAVNLSSLGELADNIHLKRMEAFWRLGLIAEANNEAELLRLETGTDIAQSYRLMNHLLSLHLYQPAIYICRNILDMAGMDDLSSLAAPIYFTHIRFGAYYREMLVPISIDFGINPLVMLALVRQESLFNPYIGSAAGAIGLAQLIPATAKENVDLLNWPDNYNFDSLYQGEINLTLGTYYLQRMNDFFSDNLQAALAAYNAGPGSAEVWVSQANQDPDLFLEIIRAAETQTYLKQITEFLNIYQLVYSRPQ